MRGRLTSQSKKIRVLTGVICLAFAVIPPALLACEEYNYGYGSACAWRLSTECGSECWGLEDCDVGLWHSALNPFEWFYGCKIPYTGDPDPNPYCSLDSGGGCLYNLFMSDDCTMWCGYAMPYCICECARAF